MKVKLEKIGDEGLLLDEEVEPQWLQEVLGEKSPFSAQVPAKLRVQLLKADSVVHVRGEVGVKLRTQCSRCLVEMDESLKASIEVAIFPAGSVPDSGTDGEVDEADMGIATYDGQEIDLTDIVRDEVFLQLPMTPVCRKSCAGLCDNCGANRNDGPCGCPESLDLRWAALRDVKLN